MSDVSEWFARVLADNDVGETPGLAHMAAFWERVGSDDTTLGDDDIAWLRSIRTINDPDEYQYRITYRTVEDGVASEWKVSHTPISERNRRTYEQFVEDYNLQAADDPTEHRLERAAVPTWEPVWD